MTEEGKTLLGVQWVTKNKQVHVSATHEDGGTWCLNPSQAIDTFGV